MSESVHVERVLACVQGKRGQPGSGSFLVSTAVEASWRRCLGTYGLEPHRTPFPKILTRRELKDFRAPVDDLIGLARDEIDRLFARIGPSDYVVLLTDAQGVTVDYRCSPTLLGEAQSNGLYEGAIWAETEQGTNGVGTCLHEGRPLSIVMDEHFSVRNTALTCTVAPIFGPRRQVLGVLDVSTARPTSRDAQAIVRELVAAAARRIENLDFQRRHARRRILRLSPYRDFTDTASELRLALGEDGRILDLSRDADAWLGQDAEAMIGREAAAALGLTPNDFTHPGDTRTISGPAGPVLHVRLDSPWAPRARHEARAGARPDAPAAPARPAQPPAFDLDRLAGGDGTMIGHVAIVRRILDHDLPMLVVGETGSGKGLFARAIHAASRRATKPFVAVNCAGIARELVESELFGYRPGAFTGAASTGHSGLLLAANGGTLFLDEIGDMPVELQTRLLQALSEGVVTPVGGTRTVELDLQVIAATLRDCEMLVREGRLREDLYHRLAGATFALPPLRERTDKHRVIDDVFQQEAGSAGAGPRLTDEAHRLLVAYDWPGNMRELRHVARFATAMAGEDAVTAEDLPARLAGTTTRIAGEKHAVLACLERTRWNVTAAARRMNVSRATLHRKMQRLGLHRDD
ncbi:MAG: sigma-54-dependent Fis family transcriptional regulator [Rhodospirillales bacterium]|nr:sigma-54-dependent Fis family transcriptional regulator [Rhodospirillales bacterium]